MKETAEILGISVSTLQFRIKKNRTSEIKVNESEYKVEKRKYFIHRDYIQRCTEKEWLTVTEVSKLLGKSEGWIYNRLNKGEIHESVYKYDRKYFIHSSYLNEKNKFLISLEEDYYTYEVVSQILEKPIRTIYGMAQRGIFKDVIRSTAGSYVSKKEIQKFSEIIKGTITTSTIQAELNLSQHQALQLLKNEPDLKVNELNGMFYIKADSFQKFKKKLSYSIEMASDFLNTSYEIAKMLIEKKHVRAFNVKNLGLRTSKYYLEEYLEKEQIPIEQLAMEHNCKLITLLGHVYNGELKTVKNEGDKRHFVSREEAERFKNSLIGINMKYWNNDNVYDYFNDGMRYLRNNTHFKETFDLYEIWAKKEIDKSQIKKLKPKVATLLNSFESLSNILHKELFLYTDDELKTLFNSIMESYQRTLYPFLNYCKSKQKCNYKGDYVWKFKKSAEDVPYTKEEWSGFTMEVLHLEKHFQKAVESKRYADTWLFVLLHFSLAWRKEDLKEFKPINLDLIGIDSFEWFDHNTFTLEKSQIILKAIQRSMKGDRANKNKKEFVFAIPFIFEMPTALVFTLCELHRRKVDEGNKRLITTTIQTHDLRALFGQGLPNFSNRKSNKTLMTYGWETAVKNGKGTLAYWLGGFSRSHTQKIDMPNPITQVYLITANTDASVEEMALHCFERGIFGWQVKVMVDAINNNEPLSLDEMTKAIAEVNKTYSPVMVDSLSKYAVTRHEQSVSLLKELMAVPKQKLKKRLEEISKLNSPSLLDHSQCLVGVKNCPYLDEVKYNLEIRCLGCKNRIDTNYILDIINVEIFSIMDRLKNTALSDGTSRVKYTHMIRTLTYILLDFRRAYDRYDEYYIRSFIDLDKLKLDYQEVEQTKFLRIKEADI